MTDLDNGADLRDRMDRATADLSAPDHLTVAVLSDGRRLRRRRRTLAAATGTAAAAVVAAMVVVSLSGGTASTAGDVATQPSASTTPDSGTPSTGPDPSDLPSGWLDGEGPFLDLPEGWWDAPGHLLSAQLQAALPDGVSVQESEADTGSLLATLDSPTGQGGFQLLLYPPDPAPGQVPDGPITYTDDAGTEHTMIMADGPSNLSHTKCVPRFESCQEIVDSDGVRVGRVTSMLQDGTITFYEATLLGPEGGVVYLSAWNATDQKPGPDTPASADVPPLTLDELRGLVQDPVWTSYRP